MPRVQSSPSGACGTHLWESFTGGLPTSRAAMIASRSARMLRSPPVPLHAQPERHPRVQKLGYPAPATKFSSPTGTLLVGPSSFRLASLHFVLILSRIAAVFAMPASIRFTASRRSSSSTML